MLLEPADLPATMVLELVREHWDPGVAYAAHLSAGAGAWHWVCAGKHQPRWFVTADSVTAPGRLEELLDAYASARVLAERGHHIVVPTVAPTSPTGRSEGIGVVHGAYLLTMTPYLEGESGPGEYADDGQRTLLAGSLAELHAEPPPKRTPAWTPGPPLRSELSALMNRLDEPWTAGPFAEPTREALRYNASELKSLYDRFDGLAAQALVSRASWVVTHGEPHTANVMWLPGGPVLVDWESLRIAPRERDLRTVLRGAEGAEPLSAYVARGGTADLDADMVELFDLEWWLWEVANYAVRFHGPHSGNLDDERFYSAFLEEVMPAVNAVVTKETVR
jgi:spectinomycin phosphotransferase